MLPISDVWRTAICRPLRRNIDVMICTALLLRVKTPRGIVVAVHDAPESCAKEAFQNLAQAQGNVVYRKGKDHCAGYDRNKIDGEYGDGVAMSVIERKPDWNQHEENVNP